MALPIEQPVLVYSRIEENHRQTRIILVIFGVALLPALIYVSMYLAAWIMMFIPVLSNSYTSSDPAWVAVKHIYITIIITLTTVSLTLYVHYRYAESIILRIAKARPYAETEKDDLLRTMENLCIASGLPQPKLYLIESSVPNAFTVGLDQDHASLVVTRGLLQLLERRELEGVIAHELSHIGNHDIELSTIVAAFVALLQLPLTFYRFLFRVSRILALLVAGWLVFVILTAVLAVPIVFTLDFSPWLKLWSILSLLMMIYVPFVAPFIGTLIGHTISQKRELLADADAVLLTRNPQALALALVKISSADQTPMKVHSAMAHLYIVDPETDIAPWYGIKISSHPPVTERIEVLAGMAEGIPQQLLDEAARVGTEFVDREIKPCGDLPPFQGAVIDKTIICPMCGTKQELLNNNYCVFCGEKLIKESSTRDADEQNIAVNQRKPDIAVEDNCIRKADEQSIGKEIKCQLCGKEQRLSVNFKCIECGASVSYYIAVGQEER